MKELISPMSAVDYRGTINENFEELQQKLRENNIYYSSIFKDTSDVMEYSVKDMQKSVKKSIKDVQNSVKDFEELYIQSSKKLDKRITTLEQNQEKILAGIDILYKLQKNHIQSLEVIEEPKKWWQLW